MLCMMPIPPIPPTAAINVVVFWGLVCFLVALFLLVTTLWVVTSRRIAQHQSQMEAKREYEELPQFPYHQQPQVQQK
jgi:uncharacterized membrane protein YozB (DUF420 family)